MTSKEIVRRTVEFDHPERVARSFKPSDMAHAGPEIPNPAGAWRQIDAQTWERIDEWGNVWRRVDETSKGEIHQGALEDLNTVAEFPIPDFSNPAIYATARQRFAENPDQWKIGGLHGFTFSVTRKLRRMEQYLMDVLLEPEKINLLHDRIDEQIIHQIKNLAACGADAVMVAEDWGTQAQTLVSPALWHQMFQPRIKRACTCAHGLGLKVFMHSCGQIEAIVPGLMAAGIDVLQFDQPRLHGIDVLAGHQKKAHITFWCPVDIQKTLQTKNEAQIRGEARELIDKLWQGRGGFIAGYYGDNASIGLEPKWQEMASDEFLKYGRKRA
jgi:hypothetical protein